MGKREKGRGRDRKGKERKGRGRERKRKGRGEGEKIGEEREGRKRWKVTCNKSQNFCILVISSTYPGAPFCLME